jgi:putative peptide zinc metalloprotease protein
METFVERSLAVRMRPDLLIEPILYRTRRCWVARDPVALRHLHLNEDELFLLQALDGKRSVEDLQHAYANRFAPRRLGTPQLQAFLLRLHRQGLVLADREGQGEQLWERANQTQRSSWWRRGTHLIAIRFPGLNPDPWLVHLRGLGRVLFHPWMALLTATLILFAGLAVVLNGRLFWAMLPTFQDFFQAQNLLLLALSAISVKILHELGHALACRHYDRSCQEMGIMLLFFFPCLYCDVSSAWTIGSKWRRMFVSAAGVYVELMLAALCFWVWWYTRSGLLNSLSFNTLLVCGVGTLLLNGNPLMRYDGYYVLADFWEIPNLDGTGRAAWKRGGFSWFFGIRLPSDQLVSPRAERWAMGYTFLAKVYRLVVLLGILALFYYLLEPYRLEVAVLGLGAVLLGASVAAGFSGLASIWNDPNLARRIHWRRFAGASVVGLGLPLSLSLVPIPYRVHAPATLEFESPQTIYVTVAGQIRSSVRPGTRVTVDAPVMELDHPELRAEVAGLLVEKQRLDARLAALQALRGSDEETARRIPSTRQARDDFARRYEQQKQDLDRLTIRSPASGIIIPTQPQFRPLRDMTAQLSWEGTPLDEANRGAWLREGTLVGVVGDPRRVVAVAIVDQTEIDLVAVGQPVTLFPQSEPGRRMSGEVVEISQHPLESVPLALEASGEVLSPTRAARGESDAGGQRPLVTSYQVRLALEVVPETLRFGGQAHCRFVVAPQSLATRCFRFLRRTFAIG